MSGETTEQIDTRAGAQKGGGLVGYRTLINSLSGLAVIGLVYTVTILCKPEIITGEAFYVVVAAVMTVATGSSWAHNWGKGRGVGDGGKP